jgi:hypothetical protein
VWQGVRSKSPPDTKSTARKASQRREHRQALGGSSCCQTCQSRCVWANASYKQLNVKKYKSWCDVVVLELWSFCNTWWWQACLFSCWASCFTSELRLCFNPCVEDSALARSSFACTLQIFDMFWNLPHTTRCKLRILRADHVIDSTHLTESGRGQRFLLSATAFSDRPSGNGKVLS